MKSFQLLLVITFFGFLNAESQPIQLHPDSTDRFVMDPATFSENDNSNSMWELAPFGNKEATIYKSGTRENGNAIITASSNSSISSVKVELNADPQDFPIIEWSGKLIQFSNQGMLRKKMEMTIRHLSI